eukprot:282425_1
MTAMFRRNMVLEQINESKSIHDLIPILHAFELTTVQDILKQKVKQMNATDVSSLFCSSLSIEKILPVDIIGHITSFYNMLQVKAVSKTFNKCYHQNKKREIQQREKRIASKLNIDHNPTATTYIVDANRTQLNENEKRMKYHGPMHGLLETINIASNGDTILLCGGTYGCSYDSDGPNYPEALTLNFNKCLHIIGIEDNVVIQYNLINIKNHSYFKNVKIKGKIKVTSGCELFMQHCSVHFYSVGIEVLDNSTIDVNDCIFYGDSSSFEAIYIEEATKFRISCSHCLFHGCGRSIRGPSCIGASDSCVFDNTDAHLKLIDNRFSNNNGFPIGAFDSLCIPVPNYSQNAIFEENKIKHSDAVEVLKHFMLLLIRLKLG